MVKKLLIAFCFFAPWIMSGHDYWILPNQFNPGSNETIILSIGGGHHFPDSSFAINKGLITHCRIIGLAKTHTYSIKNEKKVNTTSIKLKKPGIYLAVFEIKRPYEKKPLFYGTSLIFVGTPEFSTNHLKKFNGLAVIPRVDIRRIKKKNILLMEVLYNGTPISVNCRIFTPHSKPLYLRSDPKGLLSIPIKRSGPHLVTLSHQNQNASLSFNISK